jgi:hypothetical protein
MNKLFLYVLMALFIATMTAGCGQKQAAKKPVAVRPIEAVEEESDVEEPVVAPEPPAPAAAPAATPAAPAVPAATGSAAVVQAPAPAETPKPSEILVLADFDSGEKPNNVGGNFGAWNKDPSDATQWCKESFDNVTRRGDKGFSMKLDYCVDSLNPAYNGFWMMLPNLDADRYDTLSLWVKGDAQAGYTTVFKIELKNAKGQVGRYYVSNVGGEWKQVSIPLSEFKSLIDRTALTEFVVVFEDRIATNKKGVVYIDDISFSKK